MDRDEKEAAFVAMQEVVVKHGTNIPKSISAILVAMKDKTSLAAGALADAERNEIHAKANLATASEDRKAKLGTVNKLKESIKIIKHDVEQSE